MSAAARRAFATAATASTESVAAEIKPLRRNTVSLGNVFGRPSVS
jgi:hypothetical protein